MPKVPRKGETFSIVYYISKKIIHKLGLKKVTKMIMQFLQSDKTCLFLLKKYNLTYFNQLTIYFENLNEWTFWFEIITKLSQIFGS